MCVCAQQKHTEKYNYNIYLEKKNLEELDSQLTYGMIFSAVAMFCSIV